MNDKGEGAARVYSELILEQLEEERRRKNSLEQRGFFVITSSGAIVTILFSLATAADSVDNPLSGWAKCALVLALVSFISAALLGIACNIPVNLKEPSADSLAAAIGDEDIGKETAREALQTAADARLESFRSYRSKNGTKAWLLVGAFGAEAFGAGLVAYVVFRLVE